MLDIFRVAGVKTLALLARNREALGNRPLVERNRRLAAHVGAGQRTLLPQEAGCRTPVLVVRIGGPRDAAVDVRIALPEALGLPADFARRVTVRIRRRR